MTSGNITLSQPFDFFQHQHLTKAPNTCFVIMPFKPKFDIVYETIQRALQGLMVCTRADDLPLGYSVLERILTGIATSELVIADLSGKNANVFYELGLAHSCTKDVLLLTKNEKHVPFDLRGLFFHTYSLKTNADRDALAEVVRAAAKRVRDKRVPSALQGALNRTEQIVDYMKLLLKTPDRLPGMMIRIQAGFSSISNIRFLQPQDGEQERYGELLESERDLLIKLLEKGATLHAIIGPPTAPWCDPERARARYDQLSEFLHREDSFIDRCDFVLSIEEGLNLMFFGEEILFEGHKTGVESGYGWTAVYTDSAWLATRLTIFDSLFNSARQYTLRTYSDAKVPATDGRTLRKAVIESLRQLRSGAVRQSKSVS